MALMADEELNDQAAARALVLQLLDEGDGVSLDAILNRPAWQRDGACVGMSPDLFFPARGESVAEARAICAGCRVAEECRAWSIDQGAELKGLWAGLSERQRRRVRQGQPALVVASTPGYQHRTPTGPAEHGTLKEYRRGCRCDDCRAANAARARQWSGAKPFQPAGHGSASRYHAGCRCDECRAAKAAERRARAG